SVRGTGGAVLPYTHDGGAGRISDRAFRPRACRRSELSLVCIALRSLRLYRSRRGGGGRAPARPRKTALLRSDGGGAVSGPHARLLRSECRSAQSGLRRISCTSGI